MRVPIYNCNLCLVVMQTGESLLHGCATFGQSELLKELVTQYGLDINQRDHVRFLLFLNNIHNLLHNFKVVNPFN